jgi:tetratricopeptide (TPR) repeat protein
LSRVIATLGMTIILLMNSGLPMAAWHVNAANRILSQLMLSRLQDKAAMSRAEGHFDLAGHIVSTWHSLGAYRLGIAYEQEGLVPQALTAYREAASPSEMALDTPRLADAYTRMGRLMLASGQPEQAAEVLRRALELTAQGRHKPLRALAATFLAQAVYQQTGQLDLARPYLEEAVGLYRNAYIVDQYLQLAQRYVEHGDTNSALQIAVRAQRLEPENTWTAHHLGMVYLRRGELADAEKWFKQAISLAPDNEHPHVWLGLAYRQMGRWSDAITEFEIAMRLNPAETWYRQLWQETVMSQQSGSQAAGQNLP